jgi:hypothetical protein
MLKHAGKLGVLLTLAASLAVSAGTGCGQTPLADPSDPSLPAPGTGSGIVPDPGFEIPAGMVPSDEFYFKVFGQSLATQENGAQIVVSTDTQLLLALEAGQGLPLGGFTIGFNCEWFRIRVGGVARLAFVKKASYPFLNWPNYDPCAAAKTTWADDFSTALTPGHGPITIKIDQAQYDNCAGYDRPGFVGVNNGGCVLHSVYPSHGITGYLKAYTN